MEAKANQEDGMSTAHAGIFLPAEVAQAFTAEFLDDTVCREWILAQLHPECRCPQCKQRLVGKTLLRFKKGARCRCACGKFFNALTGTFLSGCHLHYRAMILLPLLLHFGLRKDLISAKLNVSREMVHLWAKKFEALERLKAMRATDAA